MGGIDPAASGPASQVQQQTAKAMQTQQQVGQQKAETEGQSAALKKALEALQTVARNIGQ